jgi:RsiW-degrading membrane proteinase PrsW (M82 family)
MTVLTAIVAAAIPTAIYSMLLWWLDRYEKEPLSLIAAAFLWGALPAIFLALVFELVLSVPLARSPLGADAATWGLAPLVEEPVKGLALIGLFLFARREFDGPLDGIVYGALVGFGFSMTENMLYFIGYASKLGVLFWVRGVLFGLNHAFFTSMTGLALGAVRYERARLLNALALCGGLALAIMFHALHNFVVRYELAGLFLSWMIQSGGVIVVLAVAVLAWRNERRWMEQELGDEVRAGVLTASDYGEVMSSLKRVRSQLQALITGGWARYRKVRRLHQWATELAFRKSQLRIADRYHTSDECDRLRQEIVVLRAGLNGEEIVRNGS